MRRVLVIGSQFPEGFDWRFSFGGGPDFPVEKIQWEGVKVGGVQSQSGLGLVVAIADESTPQSLAFFRQLHSNPLGCSCLAVLPGNASPELVHATAAAADDFIFLPLRAEEMRSRLVRLLDIRDNNLAEVKQRLGDEACLRQFITQDPKFLRMLDHLRRVARANAPVLIAGETGTGKELCARALHHLSDRREGPFIPVDCPSLPDLLFENELFGHVRGAYTDARSEQKGLVALARGGTLFLDEVDSLSASSQGKLLRFLEDRVYRSLGSDRFVGADVTILAATNRDLKQCVDAQSFRSDLYFRLNVLLISLSPLRDRPGDIPLLAQHYLRQFWPAGRPVPSFRKDVADILQAYRWPGNVRELTNVIRRAALIADGGPVFPEHVTLGSPNDGENGEQLSAKSGNFRQERASAIARFERTYVAELLNRHGGNVTRAARAAGKERRAFGRLVKKYDIDRSVV